MPARTEQIRIVIQARTDSTRLPAKTLLPVGSMPLAVLAARRLARSGIATVLATSDRRVDDLLAATASQGGLRVMRGSCDDVLARFAMATADLADDAIVVRATGDNVFPDSDFAMLIATALAESNGDLVGTRWPEDGLPYGLSLEAFRAGALRRAQTAALSPSDREHVTPWLWRQGKAQIFDGLRQNIDLARLRCTIDTIDDYLRVCRVFAQAPDPVAVPWRDLVAILKQNPDAPPLLLPLRLVAGALHGPLVLGTVQLGLPYGSVTTTVLPSDEDAIAIVRKAVACGVTHIDTARAYGLSEGRIGRALGSGWAGRAQVITKLDPLAAVPADAAPWAIEAAVRSSILRSCRELGLASLHTVLLHRATHRLAWSGAAWRTLLALRDEGLIGQLGVSTATPAEAMDAAADPDVRLIQFPFNILDGRWEEAGAPAALAKRTDLLVHGRSALLQGVLARPAPHGWPAIGDPGPLAQWLAAEAAALARASVADLCFAFVRAQPWIHGVVAGVETMAQLADTLSLFVRPPLAPDTAAALRARRPPVPDLLLDPSRWPSR